MAERKLLKENTVAKEARRKFPLVAQAQLGTTFGSVEDAVEVVGKHEESVVEFSLVWV